MFNPTENYSFMLKIFINKWHSLRSPKKVESIGFINQWNNCELRLF